MEGEPVSRAGGDRVFGRLLPAPPGTVTASEAYADPGRHPHDGRPWVMIGMIASIDGATAVDGRSGALGRAGDKAVFTVLRDLADIVLVGAGTARAERYGPPTRPGQSVAVVTASGDLDGLDALLASGSAIVVTTEAAAAPTGDVDVVRAGGDRVDVTRALEALAERGGRVVVAEGGPTLNGDLLAAGVVDEICTTIAPVVVGGDSARLAHGAHATPRGMRLASLLADDEGYLYGRWLADALSPLTRRR